MAFKVRFAPNTTTDYDSSDSYEFLESGVLKITFRDEARWTEYYAFHQWQQVIAEHRHGPGLDGSNRTDWEVDPDSLSE
jgi:hypothetical protein